MVVAILAGVVSRSCRKETPGDRLIDQVDDSLNRSARLLVDGNLDEPVPACFRTVKKPRLIGDLAKQYLSSLGVEQWLQDLSFSDELERL